MTVAVDRETLALYDFETSADVHVGAVDTSGRDHTFAAADIPHLSRELDLGVMVIYSVLGYIFVSH